MKHRVEPSAVERLLARRHNWPGAHDLRRVIRGDEPVGLSRLESTFIAAVRRARLPLPETNQLAGSTYVDCRWPAHRLTVELDGYRYHGTRHAWERDRQREREARSRGDEFRRVAVDGFAIRSRPRAAAPHTGRRLAPASEVLRPGGRLGDLAKLLCLREGLQLLQ